MSLAVNQLIGFGAGGSSAPPVATWVADVVNTGNATTYTFTGAAIGTAASDRLVVVGATARDPAFSADKSLSSATIGGNAATVHVTTTAHAAVGLFSLLVPSGTTADIVVTWSGGCQTCSIGVWSVTGLSSTTPTDTVSASLNTDGSNSVSGSIDVAEQGVIFAAGEVAQSGGGAHTWTNATERADAVIGTTQRYGYADYQGVLETNRSIQMAWTSAWRHGLAAVAFR